MTGQKITKGTKMSCQGIEQVQKAGRGKIKPFLLKNNPGKVLEPSLCRQSSESKSNTKLVLVSRKPLPYLKFNKLNKQNVSEINLFKN